MIRELYKLKKEYRGKKIYVWGVSRDSLCVLHLLMSKGIFVSGFVTYSGETVDESLCNIPIISAEMCVDDALVVLHDATEYVPGLETEYCNYSALFEFGLEQSLSDVVVYGTGVAAGELCELLDTHKVNVKYFCETNPTKEEYRGKSVYPISQVDKNENIIVSVKKSEYLSEILVNLYAEDKYGDIFVFSELVNEQDAVHSNFLQNIECALERNLDIFFVGSQKQLANQWIDSLEKYGIVAEYISETELYNLAYDNVKDKLIVISEIDYSQIVRWRELLERLGFSAPKNGYTSYKKHQDSSYEIMGGYTYHLDPLVGYSEMYGEENDTGWKIYGKDRESDFRIIVVGGSTSSERYKQDNWIKCLYYKLIKEYEVTIFNGATMNHDVLQEYLRVMRDINKIRPDVVISFSGVNDIYANIGEKKNRCNIHLVEEQFDSFFGRQKRIYGMKNLDSGFCHWRRMESLLERLCDMEKSEFLFFLQPMNIYMDTMNKYEKSVFERKYRDELCRAFYEESLTSDLGDNNLFDLFWGKTDMFIDMCHYSDEAHAIIANIIYEKLIPIIENKNN